MVAAGKSDNLNGPRLAKPPKFLDGKLPRLPYMQFRASYLMYENSTIARPHPSLDAVQTANARPNIAVSRPKLRPIVTRIIAENVGAEAGPHCPNSTGETNGKPDGDIRVSSLR
jgi:hypothetical protein